MTITLYSATGCLRCKIANQFLEDIGRQYENYDALDDGRQNFRIFYQNNREKIYRGPDGVEFPILHDGEIIRQGLPKIVAHLSAGPALNGFFKRGLLRGQWIDGIHVSGGNPARGEEFLGVLHFLKKQLLKLQIETNGVNADLLEKILECQLADRVIMEVKGPLALYDTILKKPIDPEDIRRSIVLVSQFNDYYFYTTVSPIPRKSDDSEKLSYITAEEISEAAHLIKVSAGDSKQPYKLRWFNPQNAKDDRLRECEPLARHDLFKYRTMARRHQFKTEIGND